MVLLKLLQALTIDLVFLSFEIYNSWTIREFIYYSLLFYNLRAINILVRIKAYQSWGSFRDLSALFPPYM